MLVFLLDCLRFSKLLEILPSVWCNFSNLLKRQQSSRKTSIVCRWLKHNLCQLIKSSLLPYARFECGSWDDLIGWRKLRLRKLRWRASLNGRVQQTQLLRSGSVSARCYWCILLDQQLITSTYRVNSFMQSLLQRVSFYLYCSLDVNKDEMTPSAAVTA